MLHPAMNASNIFSLKSPHREEPERYACHIEGSEVYHISLGYGKLCLQINLSGMLGLYVDNHSIV